MYLNTIRLLAMTFHSHVSAWVTVTMETYSNYMFPGNTLDSGKDEGPKVCWALQGSNLDFINYINHYES